MKVIFLDIDGVLNRDISHHLFGNDGNMPVLGMEPKKVAILNRIVEKTDSELVLSSTWRHHANYKEIMNDYGFEVLDRTTIDKKETRELEVKEWLADHPQVTKFCCIDDATDLGDLKLFQTYFYEIPGREAGLTDKLADEIIAYMNS